jgi:O-antigen/teichoic acid export membrane protein
MKNVKVVFFRIASGLLGLLFLATAPVIAIAGEGWQKAGVVPILLFAALFLLKSYRWK